MMYLVVNVLMKKKYVCLKVVLLHTTSSTLRVVDSPLGGGDVVGAKLGPGGFVVYGHSKFAFFDMNCEPTKRNF